MRASRFLLAVAFVSLASLLLASPALADQYYYGRTGRARPSYSSRSYGRSYGAGYYSGYTPYSVFGGYGAYSPYGGYGAFGASSPYGAYGSFGAYNRYAGYGAYEAYSPYYGASGGGGFCGW